MSLKFLISVAIFGICSAIPVDNFEFFDISGLIETTKNIVKTQISSVERSMGDLELQAREAIKLSEQLMEQMAQNSNEVIRKYLRGVEENVSDRKIKKCMEFEGIADISSSAKPLVIECARISSKKSNSMMKKVQIDLDDLSAEMRTLSKITTDCFQEPGIGEKINCVLRKVEEIQPIIREMLSTISSTVARVTSDFTGNMQATSSCMGEAANQTIKDINASIERARQCVKSG